MWLQVLQYQPGSLLACFLEIKKKKRLKTLKLVQHCIQLPIAKNENFSKTAVTVLLYDNMFINSYYTT